MRKNIISIIFAISFVLLMSSFALASPALSRYGINEQTKECSEFFMGDECMACDLPEQWKMIDEFECPIGYEVAKTQSVCERFKSAFCCTPGHSGASGDCEDVVVNINERKCAFVEDVNNCSELPINWKQAEETENWGRLCPSVEYEWLEETLECKAKIIENDNVNDPKDISNNKLRKSNIILVIGISVVVIILLIILGVFLIKRRQK